MYRNYTVCVHVHNLHPGANLLPGANLFAPPRRQEQICTRVQIPGRKFLEHRSHGQKYTRVQICPPGANLHPGANCAHERGFQDSRFIEKVSIEAQNLHVKDQTVTLPIKLKIARMKETRKNHQKQLKHAF